MRMGMSIRDGLPGGGEVGEVGEVMEFLDRHPDCDQSFKNEAFVERPHAVLR